MTCTLSNEELNHYLDGMLDVVEAKRVEDHLVQCQSCSAKYDELFQVVQDLRAMQSLRAKDDTVDRVLNAIAAGELPQSVSSKYEQSRAPFWLAFRGLAAACVVAGIALLGSRLHRSSSPNENADLVMATKNYDKESPALSTTRSDLDVRKASAKSNNAPQQADMKTITGTEMDFLEKKLEPDAEEPDGLMATVAEMESKIQKNKQSAVTLDEADPPPQAIEIKATVLLCQLKPGQLDDVKARLLETLRRYEQWETMPQEMDSTESFAEEGRRSYTHAANTSDLQDILALADGVDRVEREPRYHPFDDLTRAMEANDSPNSKQEAKIPAKKKRTLKEQSNDRSDLPLGKPASAADEDSASTLGAVQKRLEDSMGAKGDYDASNSDHSSGASTKKAGSEVLGNLLAFLKTNGAVVAFAIEDNLFSIQLGDALYLIQLQDPAAIKVTSTSTEKK